MRNNSGGSDGYINSLIEGIKDRTINDSNRLFVVTGRQTFSAAIIDACLLREETNAFFIGEPTSGKPNHYGQARHFELPNSKIDIAYSTKHCTLFSDESDTFIPDKGIDISIDDDVNKKDTVMEQVLNNELFKRGTAVIIELKVAKSFDELQKKADEALEQIEEKKYEKEPRSDGYKNIIKYGISFFGKDCMIKIKE